MIERFGSQLNKFKDFLDRQIGREISPEEKDAINDLERKFLLMINIAIIESRNPIITSGPARKILKDALSEIQIDEQRIKRKIFYTTLTEKRKDKRVVQEERFDRDLISDPKIRLAGGVKLLKTCFSAEKTSGEDFIPWHLYLEGLDILNNTKIIITFLIFNEAYLLEEELICRYGSKRVKDFKFNLSNYSFWVFGQNFRIFPMGEVAEEGRNQVVYFSIKAIGYEGRPAKAKQKKPKKANEPIERVLNPGFAKLLN